VVPMLVACRVRMMAGLRESALSDDSSFLSFSSTEFCTQTTQNIRATIHDQASSVKICFSLLALKSVYPRDI